MFANILRFLVKRLKYYYYFNPFVIIWILIILLFDVFLIDFYMASCHFPRISMNSKDSVYAVVIADPQLTDAYSYKQSGIILALTEFFSDIYMIRNFKKIQSYLSPGLVIFVGDLMDGGREWEDVQYNRELVRFKKIFNLNPGTDVIGVAGNHDIGFGETIVLPAHDRFIKTFGELNVLTRIANHSFVALDTIGLSGFETETPYRNALDFLQSLESKIQDPPERRILISHVPFWRPENVDCGPRRVTKPIRNYMGYQYQNLIQYPISSRVLSIVNPSLILSGDDHDDCVYTHEINQKKYMEHSIGTFSWLQGNIYPSFGVLTLRYADAAPMKVVDPPFALEICSLPAQIRIYEFYIVLALVTGLGLLFSTDKWQIRLGTYRRVAGSAAIGGSFLGQFLEKLRELLVAVLPLYFFVLFVTYYG